MVKLRKPFLIAACFVLVCGSFAYKVSADDWNKATVITTNTPIEVPGRILPAGKYMFKLMDSLQDRHIVQIMSDDQTKLYQTVLAIPEYREQATDNAAIIFGETPAGGVPPVHSWFYAGERTGVEFVYPKQRGALLATVSENNLPPSEEIVTTSAETKAESVPPALDKPEPEAAIEQPTEESEVQIAQNTQPEAPVAPEAAPPAPESQSNTTPSSLPKTASPDELVLLIGLGSAFAAWGVRRLR